MHTWCLMVGLEEEGYTIHVVEDCDEGGPTAGLIGAEITVQEMASGG